MSKDSPVICEPLPDGSRMKTLGAATIAFLNRTLEARVVLDLVSAHHEQRHAAIAFAVSVGQEGGMRSKRKGRRWDGTL
jgi:hypothetical protein